MPPSARVPRRSRRAKGSKILRYTIEASVFVNAFNPLEEGHAESLRLLATIHERGDPVIVPTLLVPESRPLGLAIRAWSDPIRRKIQLRGRAVEL